MIKDEILKILDSNRNKFFSGEKLANKLNVSRTAIWKSVNQLKIEGFNIESVNNKGYCISDNTDVITNDGIKRYLKTKVFDIDTVKVTQSTNNDAKELAENGASEFTVVIAEQQLNGKGRLGRKFYSPKGNGIYMSIVLRPKIDASEALYITTAAAVAVAEAVEDITERKADIKWVNDIYCDGKKVCGILTEGAFNIETGGLQYAVLGIGINVTEPENGYPDDISSIASSLLSSSMGDIRNRLCAKVLDNFFGYYIKLKEKTFLNEYKRRSFLIGKNANAIRNGKTEPVKVLDITDDFGIVIKKEDGDIETLNSGEVSVKILQNKIVDI